MLVYRNVRRNISRCCDCPFFINHPHEPSCDKLRMIGYRGYDNLVPRHTIDPRCPFLKE